ncbi:hypothetical protein CRUP_036323 [Coryphaenoides rupestris]|nr:hypothetical protein CRUP_036323 [Coryphaenoides rupestris]
MPPRTEDIMRLCCNVSTQQSIRVTFDQSYSGAVMVGGFAFVGGLVAGPVGIFVGGAIGGLVGWVNSAQFQSLTWVLRNLPPGLQRELCAQVMAGLSSLDWTDAAQAVARVMASSTLQQQVTAALIRYVTNELQGKVRMDD